MTSGSACSSIPLGIRFHSPWNYVACWKWALAVPCGKCTKCDVLYAGTVSIRILRLNAPALCIAPTLLRVALHCTYSALRRNTAQFFCLCCGCCSAWMTGGGSRPCRGKWCERGVGRGQENKLKNELNGGIREQRPAAAANFQHGCAGGTAAAEISGNTNKQAGIALSNKYAEEHSMRKKRDRTGEKYLKSRARGARRKREGGWVCSALWWRTAA